MSLARNERQVGSGKQYRRCKRVEFNDVLGGIPHFGFVVEGITEAGGETSVARADGMVRKVPGNEDKEFPLLDKKGNPTGETATYAQLVQMLQSAYMHEEECLEHQKREEKEEVRRRLAELEERERFEPHAVQAETPERGE